MNIKDILVMDDGGDDSSSMDNRGGDVINNNNNNNNISISAIAKRSKREAVPAAAAGFPFRAISAMDSPGKTGVPRPGSSVEPAVPVVSINRRPSSLPPRYWYPSGIDAIIGRKLKKGIAEQQ
ncbi:Hypothetical protein CINCED_3A010040 [Cinara cedri]|uniref:Uncharacterized protein n=1 Tax=Cinara cedri TaxID=506608 RepID=A0A5E4N1I8_9HEMI|nr:Hypothetical protein CINCED_3A010040 [Cinara cedri]